MEEMWYHWKQISFNVSSVFEIRYFETMFWKSSDLAIYQYSIIKILPFFFLHRILPVFKQIFAEHQLCALDQEVRAVGKWDPDHQLIFSKV